MLYNVEESILKKIGLISNICLSILILICIFIVGFDFKETHITWTSHGEWRHLGALQIIIVIVAFVVIILGFIAFTCCSSSKPIVGIYLGLNSLSLIFILSISIFALVAGVVGDLDDYIGCNTKYKRMMIYWRTLDQYMFEVDKAFCGPNCPCDMNVNGVHMFKSDPFSEVIFNKWNVETSSRPTVINFMKCPKDIIHQANNIFLNNEVVLWDKRLVDFQWYEFSLFWENIENRFECSGLCSIAYQGPDSNPMSNQPEQRMMYKYLFSDVNKGPVKNKGCLKHLLNSFPPLILAYGSLTLIASLFQIIGFIFSLALIFKLSNQENKSVVIKVDINNIDNRTNVNSERNQLNQI